MFTIRAEQSAQMRRELLGKELIQSFAGTSMVASRDAATGDVLAADPSGNVHRFGFDEHGFIGSVKSPMGRVWSLLNDEEGRLVTSTAPSGQRIDLRYSMRGQVSQVFRDGRLLFRLDYDQQGNLIEADYPDRTTTTRFSYDSAGRVTSVTDRLGSVERYRYSPEGDLVAITDANGRTTSFRYGKWNRPDHALYPDGSTESYEYHPSGLVHRIAAEGANVAEIDYDGEGRTTEIRYQDGEVLKFTYDGGGRLIAAESPTSTSVYAYDEAGRVVEERQDGQTIRYHYDKAGALAGITSPSGDRVDITYDADARLAAITDWHGGTYRFSYMDGDAGHAVSYPSGLVTTTMRSSAGKPLSIEVARREQLAAPLLRLAYRYDDEDRIAAFTDEKQRARTYSYDPEGRLLLVRSEDPALEESFAYDVCGNRTRVGIEGAEFGAMNQLLRQGAVACTYDARGNLVSLRGPEGEWRFSYSARNLMVRADGPQGQSVAFGYDAFGRRVWKRSDARQVRYVWAGERLAREEEDDGLRTTVREYFHLPGTHTPFAVRIDGQIYAYHTDSLGTPRHLTDASGRVVWSADYTAFGQAQVEGGIKSQVRFAGQYYDEETGLHYNRFRYYSPELGRYLSRDPMTFLAGANFYAYIRNDPINAVDPLGLWGLPSWQTVASTVAAVAVGAAVVALAPAELTVAAAAAVVIGAGMLAGAVGVTVNRALNGESFCLACTLKGALVGGVAAIPFLFAPAAAGVAAFMGTVGLGAISGAIGYTSDYALNYPDARWDWGAFAWSVGFGAVTAGVLRSLGAKYAQRKQGRAPLEEPPPPPEPKVEPAEQNKQPEGEEPNTTNGAKPTSITPEMEEKILYGQRVENPNSPNGWSNEVIGAHSPDIKNHPQFAIEEISKNTDGTTSVKLIKQFPDGNISRIKKSTLAPDDWSNNKIIDVTKQIGDTPSKGTRARDGATVHMDTVDGVEWVVIKDAHGNVTSSYPTGGNGGLPPDFSN